MTTVKFPRRQFLHLAAGAAAMAALSPVARAQSYPARSVRLIIGYTPGGSADLTARLFAQWLSERLGQSFVVESRPGAGTNIATEAVVNAAPDGYTTISCGISRRLQASIGLST
jgi:tripartite-type tricarboxylate transporter receptor subunit TctC